jgi:enoyl-CoA hydratase/carnithine racemase
VTVEERTVLIQKKEAVCTVTMNRPKVKNAFSLDSLCELQKALSEIGADKEIRVVILEGADGNFCAGADLISGSKMEGSPEFLEFMQVSGNVVKTLRQLPQPIICKVRGVAVGGGANLALAGDFVLASDDARFCEIFINLNIIVDWGGTYFLPRLVGMAKARELAFLGEMVDGKKAASIGLIYKSVPEEDLDREVDSLAKNLSQRPLATLALIKEGLEKSIDMSLSEVLSWEGAHQAVIVQTGEHKEVISRFLKAKGKQQ